MTKVNFTDPEIAQQQKFVKEREFVLKQTEIYLSYQEATGVSNPNPPTTQTIKEKLKKINPNIDEKDLDKAFSDILKDLEEARDLKNSIIHTKITDQNNIPILIRDARKCEEKPVKSTEAFEMQYINAIRAAVEMVNLAKKEENRNNIDPELKNRLIQQVASFSEKVKNYQKEPSQKELSKLIKAEIKNIAKVMEQGGITDSYKTLNVAKDFQNFNDQQANIVTISAIGGQTIIEAEIGFRELNEEQRLEYQNIAAGKNQPKWFNSLSNFEKQLTQKYASKIAECKHVIPTQLRQIGGMRNAFEKTTAILEIDGENKDNLKILHSSKHAGTLASLSKDKAASKAIVIANALQARMWIGRDKVLHCNTLNAGIIGSGADPKIVSDTTKAMADEAVKGKITNTSFNTFRLLGIANNYDGVKNSLEKIAGDNQELVAHLKPRSKLNVFFGLNKPKSNLDKVIAEITKGKSAEEKSAIETIYQDAAKLKQSVEKANVPFRLFFDKENVNAEVSARLNLLTNKIAKNANLFPDLKEEMLTMCASGKDRTGLAMHDQTAQVIVTELNKNLANELTEIITNKLIIYNRGSIVKVQNLDPEITNQIKQELAKKLNINVKDISSKLFDKGYNPAEMTEMLVIEHGIKIKDIDRELIKNGHTAQQAGGINAGGGTIGCFGTKKENEAGIPVSRMKNLRPIIEESASTNKIKGEAQPLKQQRLDEIRQANRAANDIPLAQRQLMEREDANKPNKTQSSTFSPDHSPKNSVIIGNGRTS